VTAARIDCADVDQNLRGVAPVARPRLKRAGPHARCRPGTSIGPVGIQHFETDRSLSDQQIDTIVRWVDAGAPKGDSNDMPAAMEWPAE
jgi:hypothetical protein